MQLPKPTYILPAIAQTAVWSGEQVAAKETWFQKLPVSLIFWMSLAFLAGLIIQDLFNDRSWIRVNISNWTRLFSVEFAKAAKWGQGLDTDMQVKAKIRFSRTGSFRLRLRVYECIGQGRKPTETVYELGTYDIAKGHTEIIEIVDFAFPEAGWDAQKARGWSAQKTSSLTGKSRNIAVIECAGALWTDRFSLYIEHLNHDTGQGKYTPSVVVIREDDDLWGLSAQNKIGEWRDL